MVISLAIRSGRQETSGDMKSTSAAPHLAAQSRKPAPRFCTKCAIALRQKKVSKIPAVPGTFTTIGSIKEIAESHGLCVEKHPKYGWTITSPGLPLLDFIEEQGWQDLQMCEAVSLWDVIGTLPKGAGNGTATKTKKPSSTRKYICPACTRA